MVALVVLLCFAATGCKFSGIYSFPLPGAVANGGNTYTLNVQFNDVQDLVPYSAVKVDDATVGHVKSVSVQGHHALVVVQLKNSVKLPANSTALVSQTSLLGEKFVAIQPPADHKDWRGSLKQGDTITLPNTDTDATIEEVLGSLSLVLNGGGIENIQTITKEVNTALSGREGNFRGLLDQLKTFATGLNAQKSDIITALDKVDHLAATIRAQEPVVTHAIDTFPAALQVLSDNTASLTKMLTALSNLGDVATKVVNASKDDLLTNLRNLQPTLTELAKAGDEIPKSLQILITFPEADGTQDVYRGDYTNVDLQIDLSTQQLLKNFGLNNLGQALGGTGTTPSTAPSTGVSTPASKNPLPIPIPSAITNLLPKIGGSTGTKSGATPTPTPTPKASASKGGGLLGGLLGANSAVSARVESGAKAVPMSTPLDQLLLGPLQ
jgi:phospholipid/cholesterol/gamma-HCH transport system substrate-binding protein